MNDPYTIRHYEPSDRDGFDVLYEAVFGSELSDRKFEWKFEKNPYVSHTPIVVAEIDGRIVGARAFVGHLIRAGDQTVSALQGTDAMVHPDHRGRGIYSRLVEYTVEYYRECDQNIRFTFPNQQSLPGNLKHGARLVGTVPTYYRIQDPSSVLGSDTDARVSRLVERIGSPLARSYLGVRDRFAPESDAGLTITRHSEIPAKTLASVYESSVPNSLHTVRDEDFYDWRFENPSWEYTAYTASRENHPVGGLIVGTRTSDGTTTTRLTDILPLDGRNRRGVLASLLDVVLGEHKRSDTIAAFGHSVPRALLFRYGFLSDDRLPLSRVSTSTPMVVRSLSSDESDWSLDGMNLADEASWMLSYSDRDSS